MADEWTPESAAYARKFGGGLMQAGTDASPVGHWTQGLARVLQGGVGGYMVGQANEGERAGKQGVADIYSQGLRNNTPQNQLAASLMGNPWGAEHGQKIADQYLQGKNQLANQTAMAGVNHGYAMQQQGSSQQHAERMARQSQQFQVGLPAQQADTRAGIAGKYLPDAAPTSDTYQHYVVGNSFKPEKAETSFDTEASKLMAKRLNENIEAGAKARQSMGDIDRLDEVSKAIGQQGKVADVKLALGPYATALGIPIDGLDAIQSFSSITSRLAPTMRPAGSGATSDYEFKQFLNALPQLSQTDGGRRLVLDQMRAMSAYNDKVAQISEAVIAKKIDRKGADEAIRGLGNPLTLWRQNPAATPPLQPGQQSANPALDATTQVVNSAKQKLQAGQIDPAAVLDAARRQIQNGANAQAVLKRLQDLGVPVPADLMPQQEQAPTGETLPPGQRRRSMQIQGQQ